MQQLLRNQAKSSPLADVLACTGLGDDLLAARKQAYEMIHSIKLEGARFREDIGHRAM